MTRIALFSAALILVLTPCRAAELTLFITSNLEGRFSIQNDASDPALLILQSLHKKRNTLRPLLYLDLGNAFYPGLISRFSFGSVAYDYLSFNGCDATIISSRDIRVGIENLLSFEKEKKRLLLSANIIKDDAPVFLPYIIRNLGGKKIAIIGISAENVLFDITDTMTSGVTLSPSLRAVEKTAWLAAEEHPDAIILLSGLPSEQNLRIMNRFPALTLCVSGGDNHGTIYSEQAGRIILSDGRQILLADRRKGYFIAECSLSDRLKVNSFTFSEPEAWKVTDEAYLRFENRLSIWKSRYLEEQSSPLQTLGNSTVHITDDTAANLMRDTFRTELSVLTPSTVTPFDLTAESTNADILKNISDDFYIYRLRMKGSEITALSASDSLQLFGWNNGRIQGYPVIPTRMYTVAATQSSYEKILEVTENYGITFKNTWKTIPDIVASDLKGDRHSMRPDFSHLENRIGFTARVRLANSFNRESVNREGTVTPPNGMVSSSHRVLNTEDSADLIFFNRHHMFTVSPYVNYIKEDLGTSRALLANIFKCVFLYQTNTSDMIKPYIKSQYQMPIEKVDHLRPLQIRNTAGIDFITGYFTGKAGTGFSKQMTDPSKSTQYGLEASGIFTYPFLSSMKYKCAFDVFASHPIIRSYYSLNAQVTNGISYVLTDLFSITVAHRYTFYHDGTLNADYSNNAIRISFDIATSVSVF